MREDLRLLTIILLIALIAGLVMGAIVGGAKQLFTQVRGRGIQGNSAKLNF